MKTTKIIRNAMTKWVHHLGLGWQRVYIIRHQGKDAQKYFKTRDGSTVLARTFSDWRYGEAIVHFNVPALRGLGADEIERVVVHELCHVLIDEMRAGGIDHEERVVTTLTSAMLWVEQFTRGE